MNRNERTPRTLADTSFYTGYPQRQDSTVHPAERVILWGFIVVLAAAAFVRWA